MSLPADDESSHRAALLGLLQRLAYRAGEVVLASGRRSDFYLDCKQAILTAEGHYRAGWLIARLVAAELPEVRAVGGLTMGADPLASAAATVSFLLHRDGLLPRPLDAFYVRKEAKGHGTKKWIEGDAVVVPGTPVAILEDVITTGGSTLRAIERARSHGLEVRGVIALVDRDEEGGGEAVSREAPLRSLFHRRDFR